ncbi:MAG: LysR substrate-binding domain-containing protein [Blautia sp.]
MLDLKKLIYLDAVYRHKNFTKASEELYISQPAISTAISSLEKEYQIKLVTRTSKDVVFTFEGEQFMLYVSRILQNCREAEDALRDMSSAVSNTLHFGISPTLGDELLPVLYDELFSQWPDAKIFIDEGTSHNHIAKLTNSLIDLAYNGIPSASDYENLEFIPVTTSEICVLMHPDHPLSGCEKICVKDLKKEMLVMLGETSIIRALVLKKFEQNDCIPNIISIHEQINCMIQMIHLGNYIGFISTNKRRCASGCSDLAIRSFEDPIIMPVGFMKKKGRKLTKLENNLVAFIRSLYT